MASSKTTLPFTQQYAAILLGSLFFPEFAQAFASLKPQTFQQLFAPPGTPLKKVKGQVATDLYGMGKGGTPEEQRQMAMSPARRFVGNYDPWSYLATGGMARPGGPSQAEQDLLNNSFFGLTAPLDLGAARKAAEGTSSFNPISTFQGSLPDIMKSLGLQYSIPQAPQASQIPGLPPFLSGLQGLIPDYSTSWSSGR